MHDARDRQGSDAVDVDVRCFDRCDAVGCFDRAVASSARILAPALTGVGLSLLGGGQCMTPLPFGCYGLCELAAFARPVRVIMPADRPETVVALNDGIC